MSESNAKFVWYELMTSDPKAAEAFYTQVIGWGARDAGMGEPYTLMLAGDVEVAGVMGTPPEMAAAGRKPTWSGYIAVDDVDVMAARILQAGGKLLQPAMDIPDIGRFAPVDDPQGATFVAVQAAAHRRAAAAAPGTPGTAGWRELYATDWEAAFAFYSAHFGWTKAESFDMGPQGTYQLFAIDGVPSGGMMTAPPEMRGAGWGYYFNVAGIDAAVSRIVGAGGTVTNGPHEVPGGSWIVQATDPQGAPFALVSAKR